MFHLSFILPDDITAKRALNTNTTCVAALTWTPGERAGPAASQEGAAETCGGTIWPSHDAAVVFQGLFDGSAVNFMGNNVHTRTQGYLRHARPAVTRAPL